MLRKYLSLMLLIAILASCLPAMAETAALPTASAEEAAEMAASEDGAEDGDIYGDSTGEALTTLKRGDRDGEDSTAIVRLQLRLAELGYLKEEADGVFGKNTEDAISALQRANELTETGEADPALQSLLFSGAELVTAANSMDPESVAYRTQEKLMIWGFLADQPDGKAGSATGAAVSSFKSYLHIYLRSHPTPSPEPVNTPTPTVGLGLDDAPIAEDVPLEADDLTAITDDVLAFVDGQYAFDVYAQTVASGDSGVEVERVQRRLHTLNYLAIVDGEFDQATSRALLYFQKKNNLAQTAIADEATQRRLFAADAVPSEEFVNPYKLVINVTDQRVYVYQWDGSGYNTYLGEMICSTGLKGAETETPLGTYQSIGPSGTGEWYYFKKFDCYAKWGYHIVGGIMFHSVVYSRGKVLNKTSVRKLGRRASHGCIRLKVEHAKWIYENCPKGTTVVITE